MLSETQRIGILQVIDKLSVSGSQIHGVTRLVERWIRALQDDRQFYFGVCVLRHPEPGGRIFEDLGIPVTFLSRSKFDPRTLFDLRKLISRGKYKILHLHGYGATNFGRIASFATHTANIVHEHAVFPKVPLYQKIADTILAPFTDRAIAVSEGVRQFSVRTRKIPADRIETLIAGLPLQEFVPPETQAIRRLRESLGVPESARLLGVVGRLDWQKGQQDLLDALPILLNSHPDTYLVLVGDGPDRAKLGDRARALGIDRQVIFAGFQTDIALWLGAIDIAVLPSLFEGLPLVLLEAMNLGKPIVGTRISGIAEILQDGETGLLCEAGKPPDLARCISTYLQDSQYALGVGEAARADCQQYDVSNSIRRLAAIYRELSQGRPFPKPILAKVVP